MTSLRILYEDNHCLAVDKPCGWLTMGDQTGDVTLLDRVKDYIQQKYQKPGAVFLGVVHRLDRPVSGVVLYARTSKSASRLSAQFRDHTIQKTYWAIVSGRVDHDAGELVQELWKDRAANTVRVVPRAEPGSQTCRLSYRRLQQQGGATLLEIRPETGRSHQIRVQLASQGWSILGDRKYGGPGNWRDGEIALHARALTFEHPTQHERVTVTAAPPSHWRAWLP